MKILTLDVAFSDENFPAIEDALFELNSAGLVDGKFLQESKRYLNSKEAFKNLRELRKIATLLKPETDQ